MHCVLPTVGDGQMFVRNIENYISKSPVGEEVNPKF